MELTDLFIFEDEKAVICLNKLKPTKITYEYLLISHDKITFVYIDGSEYSATFEDSVLDNIYTYTNNELVKKYNSVVEMMEESDDMLREEGWIA